MTEEERKARMRVALERTEAEGVERQAEAAVAVMMTEPTQATADQLWKYLIIGLLALIGIGILGLIGLILDSKSTEALLPILTALISGLLGLFVPVGSSGDR